MKVWVWHWIRNSDWRGQRQGDTEGRARAKLDFCFFPFCSEADLNKFGRYTKDFLISKMIYTWMSFSELLMIVKLYKWCLLAGGAATVAIRAMPSNGDRCPTMNDCLLRRPRSTRRTHASIMQTVIESKKNVKSELYKFNIECSEHHCEICVSIHQNAGAQHSPQWMNISWILWFIWAHNANMICWYCVACKLAIAYFRHCQHAEPGSTALN